MAGLYHYFVEGECEMVLLKALMHAEDASYGICPGKIEILNVLYQRITPTKAITLRKGTKVVFVFDTDVKKTDLLEENIDIIISNSSVDYDDIIFLQSVKNLEDELVYSCSGINNINDLFETNSKEAYKKRFVKHKDIVTKLKSVGFQIDRIWSRRPNEPFSNYEQGMRKIIRGSGERR